MQRSLITLTLLGGLLAFSPLAEAQRSSGGRSGGGFGGGGQMEPISLVGIEQVQKEISLEGDKLEAVKSVITGLRESGRSQFSSLGNIREMSEEERNKVFAEMRVKRDKINKDAFAKISKHLTDEQVARLHQIALQQRGAQALDDDKVVIKLELTEEQQLEIAEVTETQSSEQSKMMEDLRSGGREGFAQMREKMETLRKQTDEKLMAVLTNAQKSKFSEMKGKPFELDRNAMRSGGRRQRGGDRPQGDRPGGGNRPQRPATDE